MSFAVQRWWCWKQRSAKGLARPGPVFVEARRTVIVSARTGRVPSMELVMPNSRELHASATSIVNQVWIIRPCLLSSQFHKWVTSSENKSCCYKSAKCVLNKWPMAMLIATLSLATATGVYSHLLHKSCFVVQTKATTVTFVCLASNK